MHIFTMDDIIEACITSLRSEFTPAFISMFVIMVLLMVLCVGMLLRMDNRKEKYKVMKTKYKAVITWAGAESETHTFETEEEARTWIRDVLGPCPIGAHGCVTPVPVEEEEEI